MSTDNAIAAVIHDQLGEVLAGVFRRGGRSPFRIDVNPDDGLLKQLEEPGDAPPRISIGLGLDILGTSVSALLDALPASGAGPLGVLRLPDATQLVDRVRSALGGRVRLFERQREVIAGLIAARSPAELGDVVGGLFQRVLAVAAPGSRNSVSRLRELIGNDVATALPFTTMVDALQEGLETVAGIPEGVERALLDYFFKRDGYRTLDGEHVVSPVHLAELRMALAGAASGVASGGELDLSGVRALLSKPTAERYIRDTTRLIVESAYDAGRGLRDRDGAPGLYGLVVARLTNRDKFVSWFRGFSSMAESATMRAVEVGTQGISQFQTNPLIGAAAGSFAGTVARKLGQDAFLALLREDLGL
jgi:hypothetical protein